MKKILTKAVTIILWLVILLAVFFSFATLATKDPNDVGNVLGFTPLSVYTDSMSPTFNAGDLIVIKQCDPQKLEVGDIITFHTIIENVYALNTHRIHAIEDNGKQRFYTTKGDNNLIEDKEVIIDNDIVGKYVFRIPFLGKVMDFLKSKAGFFICILLPMLCFFIYQIYNLIQVVIKYKKAIAVETAEEAAKVQAEVQKQSENSELERMKQELEEAKKKLAAAGQEPVESAKEESAKEESVKEEPAKEELTKEEPAEAASEIAAKETLKQKTEETSNPETAAMPKQKPEEPSIPKAEVPAEPVKEAPAETETREPQMSEEDQKLEAAKAARRAEILAAKKAREEWIASLKAEEESFSNRE